MGLGGGGVREWGEGVGVGMGMDYLFTIYDSPALVLIPGNVGQTSERQGRE